MEHVIQTVPARKDAPMPRRPLTLALSLLVVGAFAFSACGADVDSVKDSTSTSTRSSSQEETTPTASDDDSDRTTTTETDRSKKPSGEAAPYVQAMVDSMMDDEDMAIDEEKARCFATSAIDIIGVDRLKDKGIEPADLRDDSSTDMSSVGLSMDEGNELYDAFEDCDIDLRALMLESMGEDDEMPAAAMECIDEVLTDDNLRKLMVISIVKGDDAVENDPDVKPVMAGLMGCMFMSMGSESTTP